MQKSSFSEKELEEVEKIRRESVKSGAPSSHSFPTEHLKH